MPDGKIVLPVVLVEGVRSRQLVPSAYSRRALSLLYLSNSLSFVGRWAVVPPGRSMASVAFSMSSVCAGVTPMPILLLLSCSTEFPSAVELVNLGM